MGVALVGFGYWGANLARNILAATGTELAAVVDPDADRRAAASALRDGVATYATLEDALAEASVEAVAIATPAHTHAALALTAMESGRHVLVEKPLATTTEDAERLVATGKRSGVTCMVGHTFLYAAPVRLLREYVQGGDLGTVEYIYSQRLNLGRVRSDCNALWNFGPHDVSILLYLLDEKPSEVSATGLSYLQPDIDDVCFATLRFPSGIGANLHLSWLDPRKTRLLTVVGDKKMAVFDDVSVDQKISVFNSGVARPQGKLDEVASYGDFQWRTRSGDILIPHVQMREPLLDEIEEFAAACRTGRTPLTSARHGADVVRILEAVDASTRLRGAPVTIEW